MSLADSVRRFYASPAKSKAENYFYSLPFTIVTAAVILALYYLGLDIVMIWFLALEIIAVLVLCKDLTPLICLFIFMNIIISQKNSPSPLGAQSDYFTRPAILGLIIAAISLAVAVALVRIGVSVAKKQFKPSPMFYGVCAMGAALLLNGLFSAEYTIMNAVYGLFLAAMFVGVYMLGKTSFSADKKTFDRVAQYFFALFVTVGFEFVVAYLTTDDIFSGGVFDRESIFLGWGMYNTIAMIFCTCTPACFYFAITKKHGWIFTLCGVLCVGLTVLTMSRQGLIGAAVVGILCAIWLLLARKDGERKINIIIFAVIAAVAIIIAAVMWDKVLSFIEALKENLDTGNGRFVLWERAFDSFLSSPVFGVGFYGGHIEDITAPYVGLDIIPRMYHNTIVQMLGACGAFGLIAYVVHRVQTVISFIKNINRERIFIGLIILVFLVVSLLDNHLFYLFPTLMYVSLMTLLDVSEKSQGEKGNASAATGNDEKAAPWTDDGGEAAKPIDAAESASGEGETQAAQAQAVEEKKAQPRRRKQAESRNAAESKKEIKTDGNNG